MSKQITQDEMFEPIVTAIQEVAQAFQKIQNSQVKNRVILLLLNDATGMPMRDIEAIIKAAAELNTKYLK